MEFCPVYMLRKGLVGGIESGESSSGNTFKPIPDQPAQRFDHYELVTGEGGKPVELGRSAMGVTYKAFDINLRCPVTLKVISERFLGEKSAQLRFLREARAAASVRHPNVAWVLHLCRTGQNYFYAMEFRGGHNARETHQTLRTPPGKVGAGNREPSGRWIGRNSRTESCPPGYQANKHHGQVETLDESASEAAISSPGAFAGTPEFASPEQFAGVGVDIRSDLYSLGVTLWVMVTGQTPFRGPSAEVMYQRQTIGRPI
jgi:hypothetical protein